MFISALTVCVDYSDLLAKGLARWRDGCDRLTVVTTEADADTRDLCDRLGVETYLTDVFYANGARFNKGAAMSEAALNVDLLRGGAADAWVVQFDSDIVPPADWRATVERADPCPGTLYGSYRYQQPERVDEPAYDPGRRMPQGWVIGFFTMFHAADVHLPPQPGPLWDCFWPHAGNYDTLFTRRWPADRQVILPDLHMVHLGEERQNWCGRHDRPALRAVLGQRRGEEDWWREQMPTPPTLRVPPDVADAVARNVAAAVDEAARQRDASRARVEAGKLSKLSRLQRARRAR